MENRVSIEENKTSIDVSPKNKHQASPGSIITRFKAAQGNS